MTPRLHPGTLPAMLDPTGTQDILDARKRFAALTRRYRAGERSTLAAEARAISDALVCLMDEAPEGKRAKINALVDRVERLRGKCLD